MTSLRWVDQTYAQKHKHDADPSRLRAMYYPQMRLYQATDGRTRSTSAAESVTLFLYRFARRSALSLAIFAASYLPYVGRLVLPAASFWTFNKAVGLGPASAIFGGGVFLPRRWLVVFLQSYFASRGLVRELLEPYFARIKFTPEEKRKWFRSREGLLFGFGIGFYVLLRVPLLGVLIYGIAEAVGYLSSSSIFSGGGWSIYLCLLTMNRVPRISSPRCPTRRRRRPRARDSPRARPSGGTSRSFSVSPSPTSTRFTISPRRMQRLIRTLLPLSSKRLKFEEWFPDGAHWNVV